jgi:hypothetical protein
LYQAFFLVFALSHVQAVVTILSHSLIDVNAALEVKLIEWYAFLMRMNVFMLPFVTVLPRLIGWKSSLVTVLPVLAYFINHDVLSFDTTPGIVLSTLGMVVVLSRKDEDLPLFFKLGWILLALSPVIFPDSSTDAGHTLGASGLNIPLILMAYGLHSRSTSKGTKLV